MNPAAFDVLTFDIYGTIIDWEAGILAALEPVFAAHGVAIGGDKEGSGATPPAHAGPDYELRDLASLAARLVPN